jgi:hypothetical protein
VVDDEIITEVDVVYGDDEPFFGFERVQGGKVLQAVEKKWESVDLAFRRGSYCELLRSLSSCQADIVAPPKAPELKFHEKGDFKIMQSELPHTLRSTYFTS